MKASERQLLLAVLDRVEGAAVRDVIEVSGTPGKQCRYYLDKWVGKGWYEYGVALDLGWLTSDGVAAATALRG